MSLDLFTESDLDLDEFVALDVNDVRLDPCAPDPELLTLVVPDTDALLDELSNDQA